MGAVTLALIGFFAIVMMRMSQPTMGVLFTDLSSSDASAVIRDLEAKGLRYETKDEGATILASRADLPRLRMDFAGKGLPSGGGVGYEIFDKGDAFSSTSFVQNINHLRALEGELARTIRTIGRVQAARVHLAIPERRLFQRDREAPRASIVLKLRGELGADQVRAIRHLAASAVEGLTPERVSIIDERGRLLADGAGSDNALSGTAADEKRVALERRLRSQVEEIVAGIVGPGRARVQVAAELDLNRIESRSENYDPESRVVRSTQTRGESSSSSNSENQVTVGNELPGANQTPPPNQPRDNSAKNEEVVNFEISRTTRTEIQEAGRIKRLSVAVLVDGVYARGQGSQPAYQPRSKEDLDRITALVRTAVGFDKARGDQVEVVNLPLAETSQAIEADKESFLSSLLNPTKEDLLRLVELGVVALLTMIVLMVVVRPMVRRVIAPDMLLAGPPLAIAGEVPALEPAPILPNPVNEAGERARLAKQLADGELERIGEIVKNNPRETAAVLRNWMTER
jgi:flagellar M-ring protein FliF